MLWIREGFAVASLVALSYLPLNDPSVLFFSGGVIAYTLITASVFIGFHEIFMRIKGLSDMYFNDYIRELSPLSTVTLRERAIQRV